MSIGDLFGDDLKALFADQADADQQTPETAGAADTGGRAGVAGTAEIAGAGGSDASPVTGEAVAAAGPRQSEAEIAVRTIVGEIAGRDPSGLGPDELLSDLGIVDLGLWAVVAEVERQTHTNFRDADAEGWQTLAHVIAAAET